MSQIINDALENPNIGIVIVVIALVISITFRLYMMRRGRMRAKCSKCHVVFDASRSISMLHFGPFKQFKCPACGKINFMKIYVKDSITWPPEEKKLQHSEGSWTDEELEQKWIEESKYERA
jgi:hypothetical protein